MTGLVFGEQVTYLKLSELCSLKRNPELEIVQK